MSVVQFSNPGAAPPEPTAEWPSDDDDDVEEAAADPAPPQAPLLTPSPAVSPGPLPRADFAELDRETLARLQNPRKLRPTRGLGLGVGEALEGDASRDAEAEQEYRRIQRLRADADSANVPGLGALYLGDESDGDALAQQPPPLPSDIGEGAMWSDQDEPDWDGGPPPPSLLAQRPVASGLVHRDVAPLDARRRGEIVVRIRQLERRGIECPLAEYSSVTPDQQLKDALWQMEIAESRRAKIRKMRTGFLLLHKALVGGATHAPGPDWLTSKLAYVKGFDTRVAEDIDEFDDPLEELYDMWFGGDGQTHPLIAIALLEASLMFTHVTTAPAPVDTSDQALPAPAPQAGGLLGMLGQNPALMQTFRGLMGGAAAPATPATPAAPAPAEQQPRPQSTTVEMASDPAAPVLPPDFGPPPNQEREMLRSHSAEVARLQTAMDRLLAKNSSLEKQLATAAQPAVSVGDPLDDETARDLLDGLVDEHIGAHSSPSRVTGASSASPPPRQPLPPLRISEDSPPRATRRRRRSRQKAES